MEGSPAGPLFSCLLNFSAGFHLLKPGMRVSGREISVVFVNTYDSGLYQGQKYINIDLVNESDLTLVEAGVEGPLETVADPDALYTQLKDAGMTEAFPGFLIDPTNISVITADAAEFASTSRATSPTSSSVLKILPTPSGSKLRTRPGLFPRLTSMQPLLCS